MALSGYGARNTNSRRTTPPDNLALFCALFPKSRFLLAVFWAIIASNECRVSLICPSRKAKGREPLLLAVTNTRHLLFVSSANSYSRGWLCLSLFASTISNFPPSLIKIYHGFALQSLHMRLATSVRIFSASSTERMLMNSRLI